MARPVGTGFHPTPEEKEKVKLMSAAGITQARIRLHIRGGISEPTLRKHFETELETATEQITAEAQSQIVRAIRRGEPWAVCFWLKCRAHWHEKAVTEVTGAGGGPLIPTQVEVVLVPAAKQIVESTAERIESGNGHA